MFVVDQGCNMPNIKIVAFQPKVTYSVPLTAHRLLNLTLFNWPQLISENCISFVINDVNNKNYGYQLDIHFPKVHFLCLYCSLVVSGG